MAVQSGRTAVTTPGTPVQLGSGSFADGDTIAIAAFTNNSDYVVIGGSNVKAALATRVGYPMSAGEKVIVGAQDSPVQPGHIWVDAVVSNEGVTWMAIS